MSAYVETFELPCSDEEKYVSLTLFVEVRNASKLRSDLTGGKLEAALLDATLVSAHLLDRSLAWRQLTVNMSQHEAHSLLLSI